MVNEKQQMSLPIKQAAYAGLLFFGPLVKRQIRSDFGEYGESERSFVESRCEVWTVNLWIGLVLGMLSLINTYLLKGMMSGSISLFGATLLRWILLCGWMISKQAPFVAINLQREKKDRNQIFYCFLPGVSSVRWFDSLKVGKGIWRAKEAEIWWFWLMMVGTLDPSGYLRAGCLLLWAIRAGSLLWGRDIIGQEQKQALNSLMQRWGEEMLFLRREELQKAFKLQMRCWIWRMGIVLLLILIGIISGMRWKIGVLLLLLCRGGVIIRKDQI